MTTVHEYVRNVDEDRTTVEITVIGVSDKDDEVYVHIQAPTPGSPSTSFHITTETACRLADLLTRAARRP